MAVCARGPVLACALLLSACSPGATDGPVTIQTNPVTCGVSLLVPLYGVLVADGTWGLALMRADEADKPNRYGVIWPHGYSARRERGTIALLDPEGRIVGRAGDQVVLDGTLHDPLTPCDVGPT